jgi:nicotinate dehydrogenase subunit A
MASRLHLTVNGVTHAVDAAPGTPLLYILRNDLALNGPKFGCGLGECGACTVIMDGVATRSCITPVENAEGRAIVTLEGLGSVEKPHPVQQAFIDAQAAQCGYCTNGMVMTAKAFLDRHPSPTDDEIRHALAYNLCRCGTHVEIVDAVKRAAASMAGIGAPARAKDAAA